jgi:Leucine-rich repeat (LRR) protein
METFDIETYLNSLPENINVIDISCKNITYIPESIIRFQNLHKLYCYQNQLTYLPVLPESLQEFSCGNNQLTCLPALPESLKILDCHNNRCTCLPVLPNSLHKLYCYQNQLTYLPVLPQSLQILCCYQNQLTYLPVLPVSLKRLHCFKNQLTCLPVLPESLQILDCRNNRCTCLPVLPESLQRLYCEFNSIYDILNTNDITILKYKINVLNKFRYLYYCTRLKKNLIGYYLWSKRKNYLMFSEGIYTLNEEEYTHNYILNEYVGRDIMSYI